MANFMTTNICDLVNPFIGTDGQPGEWGSVGNTFPGAVMPFGMVQWSPDTVEEQPGGYHYRDHHIRGFSLTHLSGAGCAAFQDVPIMPFVGHVTVSPAVNPTRYQARFAHSDEDARPGYYTVSLASGVQVELTATQRTGAARFTYPSTGPATLLIDVSGSAHGVRDGNIYIDPHQGTVAGWATSGGFCQADSTYRIYFHAKFDRPFIGYGTWHNADVMPKRQQASHSGTAHERLGAYISFDTDSMSAVTMQVGVSFVSIEGAIRNLHTENYGRSFDALRVAARHEWQDRLGAVEISGGTEEQRSIFYTALYHALLHPSVFSDVDGRYVGIDGHMHSVPTGRAAYTNFSGWDIYRGQAQLVALLAPEIASDIANTMVEFADQARAWDRWTLANGYTGIMIGDPYHAVISSVYAFGARDFDAPRALQLMLQGSTERGDLAKRPALDDYLSLGYVPADSNDVWGPAAATLEYAIADFCIAQLAHRLGDGRTYDQFRQRAQSWKNLLNPSTGYLQPRKRDGSFVERFDPSSPTGWVEGNAAQYTWMVPHNPNGLIKAIGGPKVAMARLDDFFTELNAGPKRPYAWMGNEPCLHTPWLYNFAGAPHKTQQLVRRTMNELFTTHPDGLPGNDDLGTMSAWYVWAALGMYPMIPGRAELHLASPLFPDIKIHRSARQNIRIQTTAASDETLVGQNLHVNGRHPRQTWLPEGAV